MWSSYPSRKEFHSQGRSCWFKSHKGNLVAVFLIACCLHGVCWAVELLDWPKDCTFSVFPWFFKSIPSVKCSNLRLVFSSNCQKVFSSMQVITSINKLQLHVFTLSSLLWFSSASQVLEALWGFQFLHLHFVGLRRVVSSRSIRGRLGK